MSVCVCSIGLLVRSNHQLMVKSGIPKYHCHIMLQLDQEKLYIYIYHVSYKGGGGKGGCENVRPENNFSKNREREITFTEIREREIRK